MERKSNKGIIFIYTNKHMYVYEYTNIWKENQQKLNRILNK